MPLQCSNNKAVFKYDIALIVHYAFIGMLNYGMQIVTDYLYDYTLLYFLGGIHCHTMCKVANVAYIYMYDRGEKWLEEFWPKPIVIHVECQVCCEHFSRLYCIHWKSATWIKTIWPLIEMECSMNKRQMKLPAYMSAHESWCYVPMDHPHQSLCVLMQSHAVPTADAPNDILMYTRSTSV